MKINLYMKPAWDDLGLNEPEAAMSSADVR
jgi:hypothetical protein